MKKELSNDVLDDIIVLTNDEGEDIEFNNEAIITDENRNYIFLTPVSKIDDVEEDEVLIFEYAEEDDKGEFYLVEDEELAEELFAKFLILIQEELEESEEN